MLYLFIDCIKNRTSECLLAVGMQSGAIPDEQISASSEKNSNHAAIQSRLRFKSTSTKAGAWVPAKDKSQWLQVDLGSQYARITRVATQGRHGTYLHWVKFYKLQYSDNEVTFHYYKEQGQVVAKVKLTQSTETSISYN